MNIELKGYIIMKKNNIIIAIVALALIVGGLFTWKTYNDHEKPTRTDVIIHAETDHSDDYFDPQHNLGLSPYTFVGKIVAVEDLIGENVVRDEPDKLPGNVGAQHTEMTVQVLRNLKTNLLTTEDTIKVYKWCGGYSMELQAYYGYREGDNVIPTVGKYYVFNAFTSESGNLFVSGPVNMTELEGGINEKNLDSSELLQLREEQLENAYILEEYLDRPLEKSIYDTTYGGDVGELLTRDASIPILKEAPKKWDENDDPLAVVELTPAILAKAITPPQQDTGAQAQTD